MSAETSTRSRLSIVRHGSAGSRTKWVSPDSLRPLTQKGQLQANAIARRYESDAQRIVSSPYLRCVETLRPLAKTTNIELEELDFLGEGKDPLKGYRWLIEQTIALSHSGVLVACTHGDLLFGFVELLDGEGFALGRSAGAIQKGSTIELDFVRDEIVDVRYLAPQQSDPI